MTESAGSAGQKNLILIFGSMFGLLVVTGIGYYAGYVFTWQDFNSKPKIGAEPLKSQVVFIKKDIPAGQEIDFESIDQRHEVMSNLCVDAFTFASEALGNKAKWALHKGEYLTKHDVQPVTK